MIVVGLLILFMTTLNFIMLCLLAKFFYTYLPNEVRAFVVKSKLLSILFKVRDDLLKDEIEDNRFS